DVPTVPIKKAEPPHVVVEKAEQGTPWNPARRVLEPALSPQFGRQPRVHCRATALVGAQQARLPAAVPVVFLDPDGDRGERVVIKLAAKATDAASQLHVLVHLVVTRFRVDGAFEAFVTTQAVTEQAQVPARIIPAVPQPPVQ